ncbi:MAG TPA: MFS transporter [Phycisphaerae bacterium]|nr:MFS transporter [Phycisphaerae bacterium]HOJ74399.1 MFS transporter [Phycisphaerae bacterium]HOM52888.1 MFS transporter [Phycisphaerae bacterium]HON67363.1 MFS transporter [Phycisphaerae bacterium]HOQ86895.1 MFS transporter [Phycisphaerae bacterium]
MAENESGASPALNPVLGVKLSIMMFLQYAVWGLWMPILGRHLVTLPAFQLPNGELDLTKAGLIYMTLPIASIIGPFVGGQIADRYFAAQRFLGVSQILGGIVLMIVGRLTGFAEVFVGMLIYNLLYAPTIALTNSIAFQHWPNDRFSRIRVWGSVGWIAIGLAFGAWLGKVGYLFHTPTAGDCLLLGGIISILYGVYSFFLPHTPPSKQAGNPLAFLDAVAMLKNPAFAIMALVSFFGAINMQFYFVWTQNFLSDLGIRESLISPAQATGQGCEMLMMVLLPIMLHKFGYRITMAVGVAAWALRDFIFALGEPTGLVLAAISLHGVGYAFFFTTIFMFTDLVAPKDIKSSAQSFLASVTIGCGMLLGSLLAGPVHNLMGNVWQRVYLVPALLCVVCCVLFLVAFHPKTDKAGEIAGEAQTA